MNVELIHRYSVMMTAIEPTIHADILSVAHNKLPIGTRGEGDDATIKSAGADLHLSTSFPRE